MKIIEQIEDRDVLDGLLVGGYEGRGSQQVACYYEKSNPNKKAACIYVTNGGCYYIGFNPKDLYQKNDQFHLEGMVGPYNTQEDAENFIKEFRPTFVKKNHKLFKNKK